MKIYRVVNNSDCVLTTASRLEALELFYKQMQSHDAISDWGWIDEEEVR